MSDATVPAHRALGLTDAEYDLILDKLGREPNAVELSMFSLMWSEHCAYKHSKKLLGQLPTEGPYLLMGPGENAGAVDVGDGLAIAFKVESHNHPSAVEPFQGAATGVGGILRDIFAVGARPIAVLDSLRFGEPDGQRSRYLLEHAVGGIGHYGNSIGVPTVGGEIYFEPAYEQNCLVNAMALGIAPHDRLTRAAATGPGNVLVLFGALTGRDGIGGASVLASAELGEDDADKRPTVQIGDPFAEKKLLECSLELLDSELLVSLQDLGAAGLTSSSSEMASKGGLGLDIHVDRVPLREPGMEPFEIMVSESQERMLCVVEPSKVDAVLAVCEKWETTATAIGEVTDSGHLRVLKGGEVVGDMPVPALVDDCPLYDLAPEKPSAQIYPTAPRALKAADDDVQAILPELLGSANIASRLPVFEQYDWIVQSRTVRRPEEADAAVLLLPDGAAIAVSIDGSGRRVAADPYRGTVEAVFECAANLACVGAEPLGLTNCLNFGNPEKPHVAWQLSESVRGMADACRALDTPVVGGNVSLYNESGGGPIYPTPVVGMVGRLPEAARAGRLGFSQGGDAIAVVRAASPSLPASELAKLRGEALPDGLPERDQAALRTAIELVRDAVRRGDLRSAHDVAEGGIAVALSEAALAGGIGARIDLRKVGGATCQGKPLDEQLFGEGSGTFVLSGPRELLEALAASAGDGLSVAVVGEVGGDVVEIAHEGGTLSWSLAELAEPRTRGLADRLHDVQAA
ncbi:phosphoribosylformylglycinamidine synthase subunit PurL [Conexibacter stalactiti]|uniref:Phosphoribosylformylglycinamidine synthase subunit PurL n=1 Tax=Conexibacter stalactiti TaxID=1940611 RepID=A0ABU4HMG2_9ACTN|nr:phosphoribosylformylglycinamidine synthase subunit PurL [Conexibacter stalactiti]MDW5594483.1 phosphoribosylformylglycinamidine synthase subunit PurL [Conexibacter stalactiti]MEC5035125.1 phosphoribosylformylglycinamidine synthase subunit PurL [Conexibacter stalactiti]